MKLTDVIINAFGYTVYNFRNNQVKNNINYDVIVLFLESLS